MRKPSLTLYTFDSVGLEGQETILACETSQPRDFLGIVKELKGTPVAYYLPVASTFLGTRKDIRDLVENLG
jgi:chlorite dismutase